MDAYIRKMYNGFYYIIEGRPEDKENSRLIDMPCNTRLQAMRYAKRDGYNVIINNRMPKESEKKSILESLTAAKQRIALQSIEPRRSVAKSRHTLLDI